MKNWRTPLIVLIAGCLISMTGFGIRSGFGLFLEPMTSANGWSRETFGSGYGITEPVMGDRGYPSLVRWPIKMAR